MRIRYCESPDDLSRQAASIVIDALAAASDPLLCPATGNSTRGLYREMAERARTDMGPFAGLRIVMLDEWAGFREDDPRSCHGQLVPELLEPLGVAPDRYVAFHSAAHDLEAECDEVQAYLDRDGPIDVCVLGLGINGHVGFNEPGPSLPPRCHVATLSEETRRHALVRGIDQPPQHGMTLGMADILASRRIVLVVAGEGKERATADLLAGTVSTQLPASFLWLHDNVDCLIDEAVARPADRPR